MTEHTRIAREALKAGGASNDMIEVLMRASLANLKTARCFKTIKNTMVFQINIRKDELCMNKELDFFGQKLIREVRDRSILEFDMRVEGKMMDETSLMLSKEIQNMNAEQRNLINKIIPQIIDLCIHNTICLVEECEEITVLVDDTNISECSDGLAGELYTEDGWIQKYTEQRYEEV